VHYVKQGRSSIEKVVEKMAHAPATCFQIAERGFIRENYYADLAIVDTSHPQTISKENILYKCGWSPLEGFQMPARISKTIVNGEIVYENETVYKDKRGMRLLFNRN